jgi:outer membrane protein with beta-barrel domain
MEFGNSNTSAETACQGTIHGTAPWLKNVRPWCAGVLPERTGVGSLHYASPSQEAPVSWFSNATCGTIIAAVGTAVPAAAQGIRPQFGVAAGVGIPTGAYHATASGDGFTTGWQGMALVTFDVPRWSFGLRADAVYGQNGANDQLKAGLTARLGQPSDEKTKLLGANVDLTYPSRSSRRVKPYVLGGVGVYHVTITTTSGGSTTDNAETKLAWNLGGGLIYSLRTFAVLLEARLVDVAAVSGFPRTTFLPVTVGVRFGGS